MNEQMKPCLLELVDQIDGGVYDDSIAEEIAQRAWFKRKRSASPEGTSHLLKCEAGDCALNACIRQNSDADPQSLYVTNSSEDTAPYVYGMCRSQPAYEGLPDMIDSQSCASTAVVYGLKKLGLTFTTQEIDAMSGRLPGDYTTSSQTARLDQALHGRGVRIKEIVSSENVDLMEYYLPDTVLTYVDYKRESIEKAHPDEKRRYKEWFETEMTESAFLAMIDRERANLPMYQRYMDQGLLVKDKQKITFELLQQELAPDTAMMCCLRNRIGSTEHTVCVEGVWRVNGGWMLEYFDPGRPSTMRKRRAKNIQDLLYLPAGITIYSLPEETKI